MLIFFLQKLYILSDIVSPKDLHEGLMIDYTFIHPLTFRLQFQPPLLVEVNAIRRLIVAIVAERNDQPVLLAVLPIRPSKDVMPFYWAIPSADIAAIFIQRHY